MEKQQTIKEEFRFLCIAVAGICLCEAGGLLLLQSEIPPIAALASVRTAELFFLSVLAARSPAAHADSGIRLKNAAAGFRAGLIWSAAFAVVAAATGIALYMAGSNPLEMIRIQQLQSPLVLFFITGGVIGPAAEELFFRGMIYLFVRRFGVLRAVIVSTAVFTLFHMAENGFPVIPMIGGIIFAASFEYSKNLITPFVIHASGNLAIFSLSLVLQ